MRAWLDRVERYVVHDPQAGQITGIRLVAEEITDKRAAYAMCAAAEYLKASVVPGRPTLQDLEIRQRARRSLWLMWAREVLTNAEAPELVDSAASYGFRPRHSDLSAEHFAAGLDYACRCLEAAEDANEKASLAQHVNTIIDTLLRIADVERLLPYADAGRKARAINAKGGVGAARKREQNRGRLGWREKARRWDSMMDEDSRKQRAYIIAKKLRLSPRTVYDALPRRRSRKSSR